MELFIKLKNGLRSEEEDLESTVSIYNGMATIENVFPCENCKADPIMILGDAIHNFVSHFGDCCS